MLVDSENAGPIKQIKERRKGLPKSQYHATRDSIVFLDHALQTNSKGPLSQFVPQSKLLFSDHVNRQGPLPLVPPKACDRKLLRLSADEEKSQATSGNQS